MCKADTDIFSISVNSVHIGGTVATSLFKKKEDAVFMFTSNLSAQSALKLCCLEGIIS